MAFLSDLDFLSWAATIAAIAVSGFVSFLILRDWRNHWKIELEAPFRLVGLMGIFFLVGAANSYSPDANAPRKTVAGVVRFVAKVQGRHAFSEYICATSCRLTGGYALALDARASYVAKIGSNYLFTYLEHPTGNIYMGTSLKVIQVSEIGSGRVLYALDLTNHPYRIAVYLLDLALIFSTGLLAVLLVRRQQRRIAGEQDPDGGGEDENGEQRQGSGPISLDLESKDAS